MQIAATKILLSSACGLLLATAALARDLPAAPMPAAKTADPRLDPTAELIVPGPGSLSAEHLGELHTEQGLVGPASAMIGSAAAPICSSGCALNDGDFYVEEDFVYMYRSTPKARPVAQDFSVNGGERQLNVHSAALGYAPADRTTLGMFLGRDCCNRDHDVEFTFYGGADFNGDASLTSQERVALFTPANQRFPGFNFADTIREKADSNFFDYELNYRLRGRLGRDRMVMSPDGSWRRECSPDYTYSFLAGARLISIDEHFRLQSRINNIPDAQFAGDYNISTHNDLFGLQLGGDVLKQNCNWNYGLRTKLGLLYDVASGTRNATGVDNIIGGFAPVTIATKDHDDSLSFVGQVGLTGSYEIRPRLTLRVAYDFMLITNLALASKQLQFDTNPTGLSMNGLAYYGAFSSGIEYHW